MNDRKKIKKAFTLVELLVVMSIIAVLMAILLPAMDRVREQGRQVVCSSNLHQLGLAMELYIQSSDSWIPMAEPRFRNPWNMNHSADNWFLNGFLLKCAGIAMQYDSDGQPTGPAIKSTILICPSHKKPQMSRFESEGLPAVQRPYALSYMMNGTMGRGSRGGFESPQRKITEFKKLAETMVFCDGNGTFFSDDMPATPGIVLYDVCPKENFLFRHNGKSNVLYLDGHSEYLERQQVPFARKRLDPVIFKSFWNEKVKR